MVARRLVKMSRKQLASLFYEWRFITFSSFPQTQKGRIACPVLWRNVAARLPEAFGNARRLNDEYKSSDTAPVIIRTHAYCLASEGEKGTLYWLYPLYYTSGRLLLKSST